MRLPVRLKGQKHVINYLRMCLRNKELPEARRQEMEDRLAHVCAEAHKTMLKLKGIKL